MTDWDSKSHVKTEKRGLPFKILGPVFQTNSRAFDFLLRFQKLGRVFGKFDRVLEKLGRAFERLSYVF